MHHSTPKTAVHKLALAFFCIASTVGANPLETKASPPNASLVPPAVVSSAELLDPEQAFQPQFRLRDAVTAEIKFDVMPGYYLYRERIRVAGQLVEAKVGTRNAKPTQGNGVSGEATPLVLTLPPGRFVEDPTFGRVEIYDKSIVLLVDLANLGKSGKGSKSANGGTLATVAKRPNKFLLTSQGCAAAGVCFPPQQHEFALPAIISKSRDSQVTESGWVMPVGGATSLGFGRPKSPSAAAFTSK